MSHFLSSAPLIPTPPNHPKVTGEYMTFPNLFFAQGSTLRYFTQKLTLKSKHIALQNPIESKPIALHPLLHIPLN